MWPKAVKLAAAAEEGAKALWELVLVAVCYLAAVVSLAGEPDPLQPPA